ncbi:MAG: polysaccharide pyruvyl transferase CsaB [Clostridia bacterium]|nr:polysaccharide pyruvyl transferase CsaB [Lachnospiraceae bacterium]MCI9626955.1 polysaccharide pyruvyl transferase CsaB [Clostridia bacterium]
MKVLHMISGGDSGGAKTHVFALLDALKKKADVKIVCFTEGVFYREILERDIQTELLLQKNRFDLSVVGRLVELVQGEQYDVIHAHGARANFIAWQLKRRVDTPIVTTVHSDYLMDFDGVYKKLLYTAINKHALKKMDYYIAVSSEFKRMLIRRGFTPNKIYTVYNGMDYSLPCEFVSKETFAARCGIPYDPDKVYIGIIGRFDKVKNHAMFLRAAKQVLAQRNDVEFVLAGEGPLENNLKNYCKENGIADKVHFVGFIKDIYSFIHFIDINTLTSFSESFPYVLLEGAKMSKPTVCSAVGGIPDLILEGETGMLVPSDDDAALGRKLLELIDQPQLREELGKNLHELAVSHFSNEHLAETHMQLYQAILRDRQETKRYDVVLSGYYGFNNSGDDALLYAIVEGLRRFLPDVRILVLSARPKDTMQTYQIDAKYRFDVVRVCRALKQSKLLLNGGGSLIQDATSVQSLYYYLLVMHAAKRYGCMLYIYANGIGPIRAKNMEAARKVIDKADMVTLRDSASMVDLQKIGISSKTPVRVTADPTMILRGKSRRVVQEIFRQEGIPAEGSYIGISVRNWNKNDRQFAEKIALVLERICTKYQVIPVFIPMKYPSDIKISERVCELMQVNGYVLQQQYSVFEMIGIVEQMDMILGMRLHTLIYAAGTGVPVIGLTYDPKVTGFLEDIGQPRFIDVSDIDMEQLYGQMEEVLTHKEEICSQLKAKSEELEEKALLNAELAVQLLKRK